MNNLTLQELGSNVYCTASEPTSQLQIPPACHKLQSADTNSPISSNSTFDLDEAEDQKVGGCISTSSKKIRKSASKRDKYKVISNEVRLELIDSVINRGEKIKKAASRLGVNYSSAKSIFQVYRKEGRADKKSSKKNPTITKENGHSDSEDQPSQNNNKVILHEDSKLIETNFNPLVEQERVTQCVSTSNVYSRGLNLLCLKGQNSDSTLSLSNRNQYLNRNLSLIPKTNTDLQGFNLNRSFSTNQNNFFNSFMASNSAFSRFSKPSTYGSSQKSTSISPIENSHSPLKSTPNQSFNKYDDSNQNNKMINDSKKLSNNTDTSHFNKKGTFQLYRSSERNVEEQQNKQNNLSSSIINRQDLMRALKHLVPDQSMLQMNFSEVLNNKSLSNILSPIMQFCSPNANTQKDKGFILNQRQEKEINIRSTDTNSN